ncbi:patatin-like phospholipase family protein [Rhodoplanes sp. Z2-YC6860]|uniref:patatin-like phospholipase family protein n=1 Tax=Rhodoplanes sp. Z2-YC6860 TaxID=674703 RepID=UPI00078D908F|nr:patatin-like phospholipase family protein [Rhodoplanes sp. Z2-YC6860]AMN45367.1 patatin [Rhodoplanes sp. Z2-YC6860]
MELLNRALRRPSASKNPSKKSSKPANGKKKINLALQGGGAHGAFTWGVLDELLSDDRIEIEGLSGTSAGAVNAVMVADGLARGGREEARKRLADFWRAASRDGDMSKLNRAISERLFSLIPIAVTPFQPWFDAMSRMLSPYDLNPLNINPLKDLIVRFVDFDAVKNSGIPLFIAATNVHTGRLRVFPRDKVNAEVVMASAALPYVFRAVEIEGVPYWDGGYTSNPPIYPFFRTTETEDVLVVQINPVVRASEPHSAQEIMNRVNEITFNASLIAEYRAIEFVRRLIDEGALKRGMGPGEYRRINVHRVDLGFIGRKLSAQSRLNTDFDFFEMLHRAGTRAGRRFLDQHFDDIGVRSTIDLREQMRAEHDEEMPAGIDRLTK